MPARVVDSGTWTLNRIANSFWSDILRLNLNNNRSVKMIDRAARKCRPAHQRGLFAFVGINAHFDQLGCEAFRKRPRAEVNVAIGQGRPVIRDFLRVGDAGFVDR
jgi:hypothetical protein